jgi:hypothetical protein
MSSIPNDSDSEESTHTTSVVNGATPSRAAPTPVTGAVVGLTPGALMTGGLGSSDADQDALVPGGRAHLLREDAFDHIQDFIWKRDSPTFDEVEEMIRLSIGGGANRNKWRNRLVRLLICLLRI